SDNSSSVGDSSTACLRFSFANSSACIRCQSCLRYVHMNPKLVPGYFALGLYDANVSSIKRLTSTLLAVRGFGFVRDCVPISRPIMPCSVAHLPPNGAYSMPNCSRCLSRRYSVKETTFQSSISLLRQSFAGGNLFVINHRPPCRL